MISNYFYNDGLESSRLSTRFLTEADAVAWTDFFKDEEAAQFLPNYGLTTNEARAKHWIERQLKRYDDKKFGHQALIDKKTNNFIGQCGLILQEIDGEFEIEVGYHVFKKYWGNGFAPEAAKLFIDFAFQNDLASSVISIIDVNNIKSQRVADKNGLVKERQTKWSGFDVYIYRIQK